jgi:hypothetical protein
VPAAAAVPADAVPAGGRDGPAVNIDCAAGAGITAADAGATMSITLLTAAYGNSSSTHSASSTTGIRRTLRLGGAGQRSETGD